MVFSRFRTGPLFLALALAFVLLFAGCGDGGPPPSSTPPPPAVTIQLSVTSVSLAPDAQQQFTAVVKGTSNTAVTWSVDGIGGGNSTAGTVTSAGLYTAPSLAGSHVVASTSVADTTKSASAQVTVQDAISVTPATASVGISATQQYTAVVQGLTDQTVSWSVDSIGGGNATVGTVTAAGLYRAPSSAGSHTVTTTSVADPTKSANATVIVAAVTVTPITATVQINATQQFTSTVQGVANATATWSVDGIAGGDATVGGIDTQGLYTAPAQVGSHTVVASITNPATSASATVSVYSIAVSPAGTLLAPAATQQFTATIQGLTNTTVNWSVDGVAGGNSSIGTISAQGLYTAPSGLGVHTISAASVVDPTGTATTSLTVVNTSPGAVLTYHNDDARDGAFTVETTLMPSVVNSTQFGKLRSYPVDGQLYAQPLFIPQLAIGGAKRNVVFAATENDTVYAFDADGTQTTPLWFVSLGVPSPRNDAEGVNPVLGITSTPVIDVTTNTMYVVAQTISGPFLHALDITSGTEKLGGPVFITGTVPGTGWDSNGGTLTLEGGCYQRNGIALNPVNNWIYLGFGHCNHGWLLAYDKTTLMQKAIFNDTPDGAGGGFWNSGGAPAIDDQNGEVYFMSGVDAGDPPSGYNDSFLRLSLANLSVEDFFQPDNESFLAANDADLGSGSPILMPDNPTTTPHEIIGGGKDGRIFVVDRDNMGAFSSTINNVIETVQTGVKQLDNIFSTPGYWNGFLYYHCEGDILRSFTWSNGQVSQQPVSIGQPVLLAHGATVSVSANGTNNGIVWEIDNSAHGSAGPAIVRAYDATNLTTEFYDSAQAGSRDTAGLALKFTVPTVASGKVFVGTTNELDIYGLLGH
jgi:hypothetical protein